MRFSAARFLLVARIALAAMLFGAASPTLAAIHFAGRPDVLARMIGVPAAHDATAEPEHHDCESSAPTAPVGHSDNEEHSAHGPMCTLCLPAGLSLALLGASPALAPYSLAFLVTAASPPLARLFVAPASGLGARGPPAFHLHR